MTTAAALSLDRYVLIDERSLLVSMAFATNRVPGRQGTHLMNGGRAMDVVAVAALDETFVDSMMIRLSEVGFGSCMTPVTELGLRPYK